MNSAEVLIKFRGDTSDVERKTNKFSGAMKGLTGKIALGNLAAKGIAKGFSMIAGSMDSAISRVDTLNNFSKVMGNLGINSKDADASIKKLSEKLTGLPTSLDSAAASVQRFTSKNGDINKSTDLFLAMNNAILAGGAPAEQQASAIEQLSQAYAKGKPDMMEWRSLQSVMPAQLKQIATEMGYAGGNADKLGEDLRSGKVSMEEFMGVVSKMNKEGGKNFKSFEEQARNATGGIQTAITNMKTAITRGVGNAIGELDKSLQNAGFDSIATYISKFGGVFEKGITGVAQYIGPILTKVLSGEMSFMEAGNQIGGKVGELLSKLATELTKRLPGIIQNLLQFLMGAIKGLIPYLPSIIKTLVRGLIDTLMMLLDNVDEIIDIGIELVMSLVDGIVEALPILIEKLPEITGKIINAFVKAYPKIVKAGWTIIGKLVAGIAKALPKLWSKLPKIASQIIKGFAKLPGKMLNVGLDLVKGIGKGITSGTTWIKNKIKEFTNNVKNSLKSFFGIKSPSKWANEVIGQNISKGIAKGLKAKTVNWKNIGKQLGEQLKNGMVDKVKDVKSIADSLKSNLSKIDLMSDGKLTDLSSIKDQVIQYGKNLSRLKGKIPADLYAEVLGMNREEGLDYTNQLLALSNKELSYYVNNYKAIQKESQKVSDAYYNEEVKKIKTQYTDKILGQLKTIQKNSKKLGKNATKGLINGMLSEIKGLDSASKQVANSIIKSIKKTLKIKSPSKVMEQMGEYTTEGFINGITSMQSELNKVMSSSFDLSPNVVNSTSTHFSPNINVNVENNMTTDPLGQVVNKVKTFSGGAKNDYNYGR